jgi:hypothetical protein
MRLRIRLRAASGGSRPPFCSRHRGIFLGTPFIAAAIIVGYAAIRSLNAVLLLLLVAPTSRWASRGHDGGGRRLGPELQACELS